MKKGLWGGIAVVVAIVIVLAIISVTQRQGKNIIRVGAVLELTGNISAYGKAAMNGIKLAERELNRANYFGERELEVVFEDSGSSASKAVSAIERMISVEKVHIVIGGIGSTTTMAMAPVAEKNRVVLLSPGASNPKLSEAGDFIFRNYPSDLLEAKVMAQYLRRKGIQKVATIYANNDFAEGLASTLKMDFTQLGGEVIFEEGYLPESTDFRTIVAKVTTLNADALYLPGYYQSVGILLRQLKEAGVRLPKYACTGIEDPLFFSVARDAGDGVIYPTPSIDFQSPPDSARRFIKEYKELFGEEPNYPALLAYDAMKIVALAIRDGGYSPEGIRDALYRIKDFPGITGKTSFDSRGDAIKPFRFKVADKGQFRMLDLPGN